MNQFELNEQRIAELSGLIADEAGLEECKDNVRSRMANDTPARVEDVLIDQHNAPFAVECIHETRTSCLPYPGEPVLYRVYFNIPGFSGTGINTTKYNDAYLAAEGALFCGAPFAHIEYVTGHTFAQELWRVAVS